jgi:hypothetical protein
MGFEPMNTGFADLQGAFALVCPRFVPLVYSMDYRFHSQGIQAHLNRHPLHIRYSASAPGSANEILRNPNLPKNGMNRSLGSERTIGHEKAIETPHRGGSTQRRQG